MYISKGLVNHNRLPGRKQTKQSEASLPHCGMRAQAGWLLHLRSVTVATAGIAGRTCSVQEKARVVAGETFDAWQQQQQQQQWQWQQTAASLIVVKVCVVVC